MKITTNNKKRIITFLFAIVMFIEVFATSISVLRAENPANNSSSISTQSHSGLGRITLSKLVKGNNSATHLEGAEFELSSTDSKINLSGLKIENAKEINNSDANTGKVTFKTYKSDIDISNIPEGSYQIKETKAPRGYKKTSDGIYTFKVDWKGSVTTTSDNWKTSEKELTKDFTGDIATSREEVGKSNGKAYNETPTEKEIDEGKISKKIYEVKDLDKDQYGIELTVEGKTQIKTDGNDPLDVVILLDNSNSMNEEKLNGERSQKAKKAGEATKKLVEKILSRPGNKVALVTYASDVLDGRTVSVIKNYKYSKEFDIEPEPYTLKLPNKTNSELTNDIKKVTDLISYDAPRAKWGTPPQPGSKDYDEYMQSKFGETFTMSAFMKAEEILGKSNRQSKKVIFHITDGVPTRSYMVKLSDSSLTNFKNQYDALKKKGQLTKDNFHIKNVSQKESSLKKAGTYDDHGIKGNGESYFIYPKGSNTYTTIQQVPGDSRVWVKLLHLDLNTQYYKNNWTYPVDNHGEPTNLYVNSLKEKYNIFNVGIGMKDLEFEYNQKPGRDKKDYSDRTKLTKTLTKAEIENLLKDMSTSPENFVNVDEEDVTNDKILDVLKNQLNTFTKEEKSIKNGKVEDPMGDKINIDLGADNKFDYNDYTLEASDGSKLEKGKFVEGPSGGKILVGASVDFDESSKTITINGLNLGEGEKVTLKYNVSLDKTFIDNVFYRTNKETYLYPKSDNDKERRDFPRPSIRDIRNEAKLVIYNEKTNDVELRKINSKTKKGISGVKFGIYRGYTMEEYLRDKPKNPINPSFEDQKLLGKNFLEKIKDVYSTTDGQIYIADLKPNIEYILKEEIIPDGYDKPANPYTIFKIDSSGKAQIKVNGNWTPLVENNNKILNVPKEPPKVYPDAGGMGTYIFYAIGTSLMLMSYVFIRKKKSHSL
ncbi:SpaA isopeptide-forming pilin-related protein [Peptostreptococcus anaerobius]|uniref:SpaA isopeptide-forming pilin-related protein n=1 Tax=Peptostreptococcus anaerobius TaxID=1261 RepID=UPI00254C35AB|nr:SpaA isopeptide-forming pilin-related protein [Peptostreptococcus anaerobius]MDK8277935.1 SpaA isopeptide-forming pilin-related protein [Peptostreptococcus anaerobius]